MGQRFERRHGSLEGLIMNGPNFSDLKAHNNQKFAWLASVEWTAYRLQRKRLIRFNQ
jgi:hypothetical protein